MQTVKILTSQNISIDYELAGLGERILGRIIDIGVFIMLYILILVALGSGIPVPAPVLLSIYGIVLLLYDIICEIFFRGQSIGKRVMKIRVISVDGARPSMGQYLLRWVFRLIDFALSFQLGALISVAVTDKKQRIGDIVAGTTLIKTEPRVPFNQLAFQPAENNYAPVYMEVTQLNDQDIRLINEVLHNYSTSGNGALLDHMAEKIRNYLSIAKDSKLTDYEFLKLIVKDYSHFASNTEY